MKTKKLSNKLFLKLLVLALLCLGNTVEGMATVEDHIWRDAPSYTTGLPNRGNRPMITVWKTDNPGGSANNQVCIPLGEAPNVYIEWEEVGNPGNRGAYNTGNTMQAPVFTFPYPGTYRVKLYSGIYSPLGGTSAFSKFGYQYAFDPTYSVVNPNENQRRGYDDKSKLLRVEQWGDISWDYYGLYRAFFGCRNMTVTATDAPDLRFLISYSYSGLNSDRRTYHMKGNLSEMFVGCTSLNSGNFDHWDVRYVRSMSRMFEGATSFNQPLNSWNVRRVVLMDEMFKEATSFNQPIGNWTPLNLENASYMFDSAIVFNQPIGSWTFSQLTNAYGMFRNAKAFNQNLTFWNVGSVRSFREMFKGASSFNQNLGMWSIAGSALPIYIREWVLVNGSYTSVRRRVDGLHNMLEGADLSTANYDATLIGWSRQGLSNGRLLNASNMTHCAATDTRNNILLGQKSWSISSDTRVCPTLNSASCSTTPTITGSFSRPYGASTVLRITDASGHVQERSLGAGQTSVSEEITTPLAVGNYTVQVLARYYGEDYELTSITGEASLGLPTLGSIVHPTCQVNTGAITISGPTLRANERYVLTGVSPVVAARHNTTGVFSGLAPGSYTVVVENTATNCISKALQVDINAVPSSPSTRPTATVTQQPNCSTPTGTIRVTAPSLNANERYIVKTSSVSYNNTTGVFSGLAPGSYEIVVQNALTLCESPSSPALLLRINAVPTAPSRPVATVVHPTCGRSTGTIRVTSPSLRANERYVLTGLSPVVAARHNTTGVFSGLAPGSYSVKIENTSISCESPALSLRVNAVPTAPGYPALTVVQPTCDVPTGTIRVTAPSLRGANERYVLTGLSPVVAPRRNTTGVFSGLAPGNYTIKVEDTTVDCVSATIQTTVNAVPVAPARPVATVIAQPTCMQTTGAIRISSPGLRSGERYVVFMPGSVSYSSNTRVFSNLDPGVYTVKIVNSQTRCESPSIRLTVNAVPAAPVRPTAIVSAQPTCKVPTGTIRISAPRLGAGERYVITRGSLIYHSTTGVLSGLAPGMYAIKVENTRTECLSSALSLRVNAVPTAPSRPTAQVSFQPTCSITTGTIRISGPALGANERYVLTGIRPSVSARNTTGRLFSGLSSGTYKLEVENTSKGCVSDLLLLTVESPDCTPPVVIPNRVGCSGRVEASVLTGRNRYVHQNNNWNVTASDPRGIASVSYSLSGATTAVNTPNTTLNGQVFEIGSTTVTWRAVDSSGNVSICSYVVTIKDNESPRIRCLSSIAAQQVPSNAGVYTHNNNTWNASATDNDGIASISYSLSGATTAVNTPNTTLNGQVFEVGSTTVTWRAADNSGNVSICSYVVTIKDSTPPTIRPNVVSCNSTVVAIVPPNTGRYTHNNNTWNVSATDNHGIASISYSLSGATTVVNPLNTTLNGQLFEVGNTIVTWVAIDSSGNSDTCKYVVNVQDTTPPTIRPNAVSCNSTVIAIVPPNTGRYTHNNNAWNVSATDNHGIASISYSLSGATTMVLHPNTTLNGQLFEVGNTIVTWIAIDSSGNSDTCKYVVNVQDTTPPTIISGEIECSDSIVVAVSPNNSRYRHTHNGWNPSATDNDGIASISYSLSGATTVVNSPNTTLNGQIFEIGNTIVTWVAIDSSGNTDTCKYVVRIEDITPPEITCNDNDSLEINLPNTSGRYIHGDNTWDVSATDNVGVLSLTYILDGATTIINSPNTSLNGQWFEVGYTTITWIATDSSGNADTCNNIIHIKDTIPPTTTSGAIVCNDTAELYLPPSNGEYTHTNSSWDVSATDNDGIASLTYSLSGASTAITISNTTLNGQIFEVGNTLVTWVAIDSSGNTDTCAFNVNLEDTIPPEIRSGICNDTVLAHIPTTSGQYVHVGSTWDVSATDNDGVASLTYSLEGATIAVNAPATTLNGQIFEVGNTIVTWVAIDSSGNTDTCRFNVNVEDTVPPEIDPGSVACVDTVVVNLPSTSGRYIHSDSTWDVSATDNDGVASLTYSLSGATTFVIVPNNSLSGQLFEVGYTLVTWVAVDSSGNTDTCSFTVHIEDTIPPTVSSGTIACEDMVDIILPEGTGKYTHEGDSWDASATDNDGVASFSYTLDGATTAIVSPNITLSGQVFEVGYTTVTWIAVDSSGNSDTCGFLVHIQDTISPTISSSDSMACSDTLVLHLLKSSGQYTHTGTHWDVTAVDNDGIESLSYSLSGATNKITYSNTSLDGQVFEVGYTTITWVAVDSSGNTDTCISVLRVIGLVNGEFVVPEGISPNGDGLNDVWEIEGLERYPNNKVTIMNRWGIKVFEAKGYQNNWRGQSNYGSSIGDEMLPEGTYFYIIDTGNESMGILKGYVYINR